MEFLYTVDPTVDEPIMLINRHIGFDQEDGFGIMGDLFQQELLLLDSLGKKRIQVWINSVGGKVIDGYNIYNAILKSKTPVDTYCVGLAASIAGVIFQAGRKRIMADYGILMYHNPYGGESDKGLVAMRDSLITMVATKSGKPEEEIAKMMNRETFINAEDAINSGMCDEIEASVDFNKKHWTQLVNQDGSNIDLAWKEANTILNQIFDKPNSSTMKKVANKLNLNAEASEDAIVLEIEAVQNKVVILEGQVASGLTAIQNKEKEVKEAKEALEAKEKELTATNEKLAAIENKAKQDKEAADKKAAEEKAEKAKDLVEGAVAAGRIKNEAAVIEKWTANAVADFEGTKAMIDGLTVNKAASKIVTETSKVDNKGLVSVVRNTMANKLAKFQTAK